jgi:hypothetical protein
MLKIPYTNDKPHTVYVGPVSIPPGGTRMVDQSHLNPEPAAAQTTTPPPDVVGDLLKRKAGEVIAALAELDAATLVAAEEAERAAAKPRTSVLEAITAEKLRRAEQP